MISSHVHGILELLTRLLVLFFLEQETALGNDHLSAIGGHLGNQGLGVRDFFQFILNSDLQLQDLVRVLSILNLLSDLLSLGVQASLVQRLCVIQLVRVDLRVKLGQLIVHVGRLSIVLNVIITVTEERQGCTVPRRELELVGQELDHLISLMNLTILTSWYFWSLTRE